MDHFLRAKKVTYYNIYKYVRAQDFEIGRVGNANVSHPS